MRKIEITKNVKSIAEDYSKEIKSKPHYPKVILDPWERLTTLKDTISQPTTNLYHENAVLDKSPYIQYIEKILSLLEQNLLNCLPSDFKAIASDFEAIISKVELGKTIKIDNSKPKKFADILVDKMLYEEMRHNVFPKYVRRLKVKSCVYCNAAYAVTDEKCRGYYDLDHWMPKSLYPYLCISFFNLQPSCPVCNRTKGNDEQVEFFNLYEEDATENLDVMNLDLDELSIAHYLLNHTPENLHIRLAASQKKYLKICNDMNAKLHITDMYAEHKDVAEEVVWKCLAYNRGYLQLTKMSFGNFAPTTADVNRFILGTYANPEEIHKRPMTQLVQGIAKQFGIL